MNQNFYYNENRLFCEENPINTTATPQYIYSTKQAVSNLETFQKHLDGIEKLVAFSIKSCNNHAIVRALIQAGAGIDCVSLGEMKRAVECGCSPQKIVLAGVGKTDEEITFAIENEIFQINVESVEEMQIIQSIAGNLAKNVRVALRVNPHLKVENYTHDKITTGKIGNKFGIDITDIPNALDVIKTCENLEFVGFSCHIGSQILDVALFEQAFEILTNLILETQKQGFTFKTVDFGGGIGIQYRKTDAIFNYTKYASSIKKCLAKIGENVLAIFEPGRSISANSAVLIAKVLYVKEASHTKFAIIDAGMNDLIRPAMYESFHEIVPVELKNLPEETYAIVGPICESSDFFHKKYTIQELHRGDFIAILNAGAYGEVMSSRYNLR